MTIAELIMGLPVVLTAGSESTVVLDVVEDSRAASAGSLFIARVGTRNDGAEYIAEAISRGASVVLAKEAVDVPSSVALLTTSDPARIGAVLAERCQGNPTGRLALVGITGTNGKTTTAHLLRHLVTLDERRCGLIGTVVVDTGNGAVPATLTTPGAPEISRLAAEMVEHGCTTCVMEASSHALHQGRTAGLAFTGGIFTNLSGDHLDYHESMDDYLEAKLQLVRQIPESGWLVVNDDDPTAGAVSAEASCDIVHCSLSTTGRSCNGIVHRATLDTTEVSFIGPWGAIDVEMPLPGRHNVMNALEAAAAAWKLGVGIEALKAGLSTAGAPPGRLESVDTLGLGFSVFVDYAHTDDALANVLQTIRPLVPDTGRLRVLFGCGGDRDRRKRPRMAEVAVAHADEVIVTSDNPRTEDPQSIIDDAMTGIPSDRVAIVASEVDRAVAIEAAVNSARAGDVIVIAGKGHEDYQIVGTEKRPFDDREIARHAIEERSRQGAHS